MTYEEKKITFLNKVTDEPKMFAAICTEAGMHWDGESQEIVRDLHKENRITLMEEDDILGLIQKKQPFKPLTPEDKDRLLDTLLNSYELELSYFADTKKICIDSKLKESDLRALFPQFHRHGLIEYGSIGGTTITELVLHQSAADYYRVGGFTFEETILNVKLQKLFAELHELEKSKSWEKLGTVMGIVANITDIISRFKS